jgi:hypothetical protein
MPGIFWYNVYQKIPDTDSGVHLVYQNSCILIRQDGITKMCPFLVPVGITDFDGARTPIFGAPTFVPLFRVAGTPKMAHFGPMTVLPVSG